MGYWKNRMIEEQQRGWTSQGDKHVCVDCFNDYAICSFIENIADSCRCDYCGSCSLEKKIAAPIDSVIEFINDGLLSEWSDPDTEGIAYETREGGYQAIVLNSFELFYDELGDIFNNEAIQEALINSYVDRVWCVKDYYLTKPTDILIYGWKTFVNTVKHKIRYLFSLMPTESTPFNWDEIRPGDFLSRLGEVVQENNLVQLLPANTLIYRARPFKDNEAISLPQDVGTPPISAAIYSNRMSPSGIPMFYGAFEKETAFEETLKSTQDKNMRVIIGRFKTARTFQIIDFTTVPDTPSIFDPIYRDKRPSILFLKQFIRDLSEPINKDGIEHIEYVPTQIVTEYFKNIFCLEKKEKIHGILYNSAVFEKGRCCVLFFDNCQCCQIHEGWDNERIDGIEGAWKFWLGLESIIE